ncbi:MAG: hypothetical protein QI223_05140 [Candidatus Korarchaeota archaeon]|nr:hypothetical protein [Candidatus Korarchaeota archaeon]
MQGTIERIWENERADGSKYWVVTIDGKRYSTLEQDLLQGLQRGDAVEFTFTTSGRYKNLLAIRKLDDQQFRTADTLVVSAEALRIVRMNCLRTAAEMLKDTTLLPEHKVAMAISMAERLEAHVLGKGDAKRTSPNPGDTTDLRGGQQ